LGWAVERGGAGRALAPGWRSAGAEAWQ